MAGDAVRRRARTGPMRQTALGAVWRSSSHAGKAARPAQTAEAARPAQTAEVAELARAGADLIARAAAAGWRGPDPYNGLWWRWPRVLVGGSRRRQVMTQLHVRAPIDVRALYRRTHPIIPKALALFGSAGLRAHALTADRRSAELALAALELLNADCRAGPRAWGYHWDVQTRWP